jgi:hypothetical protein
MKHGNIKVEAIWHGIRLTMKHGDIKEEATGTWTEVFIPCDSSQVNLRSSMFIYTSLKGVSEEETTTDSQFWEGGKQRQTGRLATRAITNHHASTAYILIAVCVRAITVWTRIVNTSTTTTTVCLATWVNNRLVVLTSMAMPWKTEWNDCQILTWENNVTWW